jgi:hypothetical protein
MYSPKISNENSYVIVSNIFIKFTGSSKIKVQIFCGTTQRHFCPICGTNSNINTWN